MNPALMTQRPRLGHTVVRANMAGAGAALTIAGFLLIVFQFIALHAALVRDVHVQARIIGANSVAALLFNDRRAAEETLGALGHPHHCARPASSRRYASRWRCTSMVRPPPCVRPMPPCCAKKTSPR